MTSDEDFLNSVLDDHEPTIGQIESMNRLRRDIEKLIKTECPKYEKCIIAGSYVKKTLIKDCYDLDIVFVWPSYLDLKDLFKKLGGVLSLKWSNIIIKNVAWRILYTNTFHVDVIPAKCSKKNEILYLFSHKTRNYVKTNINLHLSEVNRWKRKDIIKLLKLWKCRKKVPIKTFTLEQIIHKSCRGLKRRPLAPQLDAVFNFLYNNILDLELRDPANDTNIITYDLDSNERKQIRRAAENALNRDYWGQIFQKNRSNPLY